MTLLQSLCMTTMHERHERLAADAAVSGFGEAQERMESMCGHSVAGDEDTAGGEEEEEEEDEDGEEGEEVNDGEEGSSDNESIDYEPEIVEDERKGIKVSFKD